MFNHDLPYSTLPVTIFSFAHLAMVMHWDIFSINHRLEGFGNLTVPNHLGDQLSAEEFIQDSIVFCDVTLTFLSTVTETLRRKDEDRKAGLVLFPS